MTLFASAPISISINNQIDWIIQKHVSVNHMYTDNPAIPYEFHLRLVVQNVDRFIGLLNALDISHKDMYLSAWGHDLIEDTRVSYNDCVKVLGEFASDIIYAVSNEKGKSREERANEKYYQGIRDTQGAVFIKLADRIANVEFSKFTRSRMFNIYQKENAKFMESLRGGKDLNDYELLEPMFNHLESLFL